MPNCLGPQSQRPSRSGIKVSPEGLSAWVTFGGEECTAVPDVQATIEDRVAEDDSVVVRNHWTGTDAASLQRLEFSGIVTWRIANRQIAERWAYLENPHPVRN